MGGELTLVLALGLGFYMAWAIGANDVANAMGTSVGSKALTVGQAVIVAGLLEFLGAYLVGGHVTKTIRGGILDVSVVTASPDTLVFGMLAALTAAGTWLILASRMGWPVSTTHSIVGAIAGFGTVAYGFSGVEWGRLVPIVASWVASPLLSGTAAFLLMVAIRRTILDRERPIDQVKRWGPVYAFSVLLVLGLVTLYKGLKHLYLDFSLTEALLLSSLLGLIAAFATRIWLNRIQVDPKSDRDFHYDTVERMFRVFQILSACALAFAHGSNDVANAIGPVAAVVAVRTTGGVAATSEVPAFLLLIGGIGIVLGLAMYGRKVMATIGEKITQLTPTRGYAAEFAAAATIVVASRAGIPVSTTHVLVGAVLGVGLARGFGALDYRMVGTIFVSWIVTIPVGALLAMFFFYFFKGLLISVGGG